MTILFDSSRLVNRLCFTGREFGRGLLLVLAAPAPRADEHAADRPQPPAEYQWNYDRWLDRGAHGTDEAPALDDGPSFDDAPLLQPKPRRTARVRFDDPEDDDPILVAERTFLKTLEGARLDRDYEQWRAERGHRDETPTLDQAPVFVPSEADALAYAALADPAGSCLAGELSPFEAGLLTEAEYRGLAAWSGRPQWDDAELSDDRNGALSGHDA